MNLSEWLTAPGSIISRNEGANDKNERCRWNDVIRETKFEDFNKQITAQM